MNRLIPFFFLLSLSLVAYAQVDKKDQSKLTSAQLAATNAEKKVTEASKLWDDCISAEQKPIPSLFDSMERRFGDAEKYCERSEDYLSKMTSGATEQAQVRQRLTKIKSDISKLRERIASEKSKMSDENATLETGLAKDQPILQAVQEKIANFNDSVQSGRVENDVIDNYFQATRDAESLIEKYSKLRAESGEAQAMVSEVSILANDLETSKERLNDAVDEIPALIDDAFRFCDKMIESALREGNYGQFPAFVEPKMNEIQTWKRTYSIISKGQSNADPTVISNTDAKLKKIADLMVAQEAKIIAQTKLPANVYAGGDKIKLSDLATEVVKKATPGINVLTTRFPDASWHHVVKWVWNSSNSSWYKRDYSFLNAYVIVSSPDGKQAWLYPCAFTKDHLNGGAVTVIFSQSKGKPTTPSRIMLIEKVE